MRNCHICSVGLRQYQHVSLHIVKENLLFGAQLRPRKVFPLKFEGSNLGSVP